MAFPETPARKLLPGGVAMVRTVAGAGLGFGLNDAGRFFSDLWELTKAKAAELGAFFAGLLSAPAKLGAFFAGLLSALAKKADELFPPGTRSETLQRWLHVAVTVVLPAALGALALLCLARCCCAGGRRRGRATMVAPGRGGARMPRGAFEGNPGRYFRDLRAGKPLVY